MNYANLRNIKNSICELGIAVFISRIFIYYIESALGKSNIFISVMSLFLPVFLLFFMGYSFLLIKAGIKEDYKSRYVLVALVIIILSTIFGFAYLNIIIVPLVLLTVNIIVLHIAFWGKED